MAGFIKKEKSHLTSERELKKARAILFLPVEHTRKDIVSSFIRHVKGTHPDTTSTRPLHPYSLEDFRWARDILIKELKN